MLKQVLFFLLGDVNRKLEERVKKSRVYLRRRNSVEELQIQIIIIVIKRTLTLKSNKRVILKEEKELLAFAIFSAS